ncbi:MAG: hypothetical protein JNL74_00030 [Fibrobacteres bacterium]|nr:hypothetical protein [Fibrobacterota bacterium]
MKTTTILAILMLLVINSVNLFAADDPLAGRPFPETRLGVGAGAKAMGSAQTAYLSPSNVIAYWNGAMGVMLPEKRAITASYSFLALGRREGVISFTSRIPPRGALSAAVVYHGDGSVPIYDSDGELEYTDGGITSTSLYLGFSYLITRKLSMGLATVIRSVTVSAAEEEEVAAWEVGSLFYSIYYQIRPGLSAGLNLREISSTSRFEAPTYGSQLNTVISDGVPLNLRAGLAWVTKISNRSAAFTLDGDWYFIPGTIKKEDNPDWNSVETVTEIHGGAEYFVKPNFPVRIGYSTNQGPSAGFGLHFPKTQYRGIKLDYAMNRELNGAGLSHSFSWTLPF